MKATEDAEIKALLEVASAFWQSRRSRLTSVRKIICEIVFKSTSVFETEWILKEARKQDSLISMSTVYRTLKGLREADLVTEAPGINGKGYYQLKALGSNGAACIICKDCGKVIPIEDPCLALREGAQARNRGFKAIHVRLETEATCNELEQHGVCRKDGK